MKRRSTSWALGRSREAPLVAPVEVAAVPREAKTVAAQTVEDKVGAAPQVEGVRGAAPARPGSAGCARPLRCQWTTP